MKQKIALVIGGLKGIGKAISIELAQQGFVTYATSREESANDQIKNLIPLRLDLQDEADIKEVFQMIYEEHGKLDILVNNAGISIPKPLEETEPNEWETVFKTNVFGPFLCTKLAFPLMQQNGGRIINTSSIMTKRPLEQNSIYAASKSALNGFSQTLLEEWNKYQILHTTIYLGATYTDLWQGVTEFSQANMLHVADVARVVSFIATNPLTVRIDDITLVPPKGVL